MDLQNYLKAGYPGFYIETEEPLRAISSLETANWQSFCWDCLRGLTERETGRIMEDLPDPLAATRRQNRGNDSFKRPSQGPYKRGHGPSGRINGKHFVTASPQDRHGLKSKATREILKESLRSLKKINLKANQSSRNGDASAARPPGSAEKSFMQSAHCVKENLF